jgi:quercetin dioxygenase-like cupin family protein
VAVETPFPGVRRESRHTEQATLTRYEFEPGAEFPLHTHREEQITVILSGSVELAVGGELQRLGPGETSVIAANLEHGLRAGPEGATFLAVLVPRRNNPDAYEIKGDAQ